VTQICVYKLQLCKTSDANMQTSFNRSEVALKTWPHSE
jgi:hypothetical protein